MKRTIGLLICGHVRDELVETFGEYDGFFRTFLGEDRYTYKTYMVVDNEFPQDVSDCDGYVLSGSAHGAYEDHAFIEPLEDLIRAAHEKRIPLIGICFGHQIMAQALGGKVVKFSGGWGLGLQSYNVDLGNGPQSLTLNAVHQDQVVELPPDAKVLGSNEFCANAALSYGNHAFSIQPHPEFERPFVEALIELRRGHSFPDDVADKGIATLDRDNNNSVLADHINGILSKG